MTAIVAVLNKHCAAIAADSAATMGNTHKVVNSANKIFTLSKFQPVAVMTYNNASYMGIPWDIIIKEYRKKLNDKSYDTLKEYVDDFIGFIHEKKFCGSETKQSNSLVNTLKSFYDSCVGQIASANGISPSDVTNDQISTKLNECLVANKQGKKCPEFENYNCEDFKTKALNLINEFAKNNHYDCADLLAESFFYYLSVPLMTQNYTGLVFVGYGEEELYPSLYPIIISQVFDNRIRYYYMDKDITKIGDERDECLAAICPFAQTDVTQTIIRGINPSFLEIIYKVIDKSIISLKGAISKVVSNLPTGEAISNAINGIDMKPIINHATSEIKKEMNDSYTQKLIDTIIVLDKEDMANMAESFISLTSLVRRMSPGEETVGGPVDVAVISKGDGFVWINRKHYFKPELNSTFFGKYFKV